jgi:hypothetical protein
MTRLLLLLVVVAATILGMTTATRLLPSTSGSGGFVNPLAYPTLTRYGSTPVLSRGGVGTWDHNTIAGQQVFWDTRLSKWVMVYGGLDKDIASGGIGKIGLAYADKLEGPWAKEPTNPVYTAPGGDVMSATANIVQVGPSSYRLYSQIYPASTAFAMATSTDMLSWTDVGHVFTPGASGQWDDDVIFDPHPALIGGTTYLWYGGQKTDTTRGIGLATSPDGVTFTRQGRLTVPQAGEANVSYGAPAILWTDASHYSIFNDVALTGSDTTRFIDRRDTTDGSTFSHVHQMLVANPSGWDSVQVFDPAPVVRFGVLYLFYVGSPTTGSALGLSPDIGLATVRWP